MLLDNKADIDKCANNGASLMNGACFCNHIEPVKYFFGKQGRVLIMDALLCILLLRIFIELVEGLLDNKAENK